MTAPKPFSSSYIKVILPTSELCCRIAYAIETRSAWKFSCGDGDKAPSTPYKTPRTLREHIMRNDERAPHDNWGHGIEIATPAKAAAAAALPETSYIITRDEDDKVIRRTGVASTASGSVQAPAYALQAPQYSFPQITSRPLLPTFPAQRNNHPTMSSQPFNSMNGHVILPPTETRCRIAHSDDSLSGGWRFSCGTSATEDTAVLCNHQSLRNHLSGTRKFAHHRRDGIVLASKEEAVAAEAQALWRPVVPYIITKDANKDATNTAGIAVPGFVQAPDSMAQAPASAAVARVSISQQQSPPGFSPAPRKPRSGRLPRTSPLYNDNDYLGVPREVRRLEHEPVGTYLVRGNYLYHETRNTQVDPTFRLHGIYERIDQ